MENQSPQTHNLTFPETGFAHAIRGRGMRVPFERVFAMPSLDTFSIQSIKSFVRRYLNGISVDPFARNSRLATYRNDIDKATNAEHHMDAEVFCQMLETRNIHADSALFDPPYSPRQIAECYRGCGIEVGMKETQNAALYKRVRNALDRIIKPGGVVLSFGWNSAGMGKGRGYSIIDVLLVNHGGGHNDTICIAEIKHDDQCSLL